MKKPEFAGLLSPTRRNTLVLMQSEADTAWVDVYLDTGASRNEHIATLTREQREKLIAALQAFGDNEATS